MCTKRQQSSPLCSNNSVLLRALLVWMFNLQCVLWGTELPHCTILLATLLNICLICSVRLISFQVCSSRKEIPFQLYIFTTHLHTHVLLLLLVPALLLSLVPSTLSPSVRFPSLFQLFSLRLPVLVDEGDKCNHKWLVQLLELPELQRPMYSRDIRAQL